MHAHISNRFGQLTIRQHTFHVQIFHADDIVLSDEHVGELVQKVFAAIRYGGVDACDDFTLFVVAFGTLTFTGKLTLGYFEFTGTTVGVFWST